MSAQTETERVATQFLKPWERPKSYFEPPPVYPKYKKYGKKHWQKITFFTPKSPGPHPVVIALGGVGSDWFPYRLVEAGYALAVLPNVNAPWPKPEETIGNFTDGISYLRDHAAELNIDPENTALFGGQTAALLATDPEFLTSAGIPFDSVRAAVIPESKAFDLPAQAAESDYLKNWYSRIYGKDQARLVRFSAASHVQKPNAPAFLFMASKDFKEATEQSTKMAQMLAEQGTDARFVELPAFLPKARNTYFLAEPEGSGKELIPFLNEVLGSSKVEPRP
ncbi:hypothetical protein SZ64_08975 [Erythrobacter sp. SG61-1L]|uniref:hypothetical protein n=1 Tax=Erythrobacter sp. SG61-1L TaxID=1603897 RepID=UPI0006C8EA40|nr:hypothetical protein [Erythrobacter sp. SG61-1L]KPL68240.1 hypothetical protein SZ64_08975 [Erythrobacter sp. SG61-1L]